MSAVAGWVDSTGVGVWDVGLWSASGLWGGGDPQRASLDVDRYVGDGYWGRHCWVTDWFVRW